MPVILGNLIVIAALAGVCALAIRSIWKGRKSGGCNCSGGCAGCGGSCQEAAGSKDRMLHEENHIEIERQK